MVRNVVEAVCDALAHAVWPRGDIPHKNGVATCITVTYRAVSEYNHSLPIYFTFRVHDTYFWCALSPWCAYAWMRVVWIGGDASLHQCLDTVHTPNARHDSRLVRIGDA